MTLSRSFLLLDDSETKKLPARFLYGQFETHKPLLRALNTLGYGVFETVNITDGTGRKEENITHLASLYADLDKGFPPGHLWGIPPTRTVCSSPGKYYAFWDLQEPLPMQENREQYLGVLSALVQKVGGDPMAKDISRVLRVPGFYNNKPKYIADRPIVKALGIIGPTYTLSELEAVYGKHESAAKIHTIKICPSLDQGGAMQRFLKGLGEPPETGSGLRNGWLYAKACWGVGNLGLSEEEVEEAMQDAEWSTDFEYNEISRTVRNAARYARKFPNVTKQFKVEV